MHLQAAKASESSAQSAIRIEIRCILKLIRGMLCFWVSIEIEARGRDSPGFCFGLARQYDRRKSSWTRALYKLIESNHSTGTLLTIAMRRLSRLDRSIDRLRSQSTYSASSFLCSACLRRAPFSTSTRCLAAPGKLPRTERLRRKIWGTDEPPGLEDPYGGPSIVEERQAAREMERSIEKEGEPLKKSQLKTPAPVLDATYEPAKTWDGLEEVGEPPVPEFFFEGFIPAEKVTDPYEATAALHRAVVEVFTLRQAGRPLSELSSASTVVDRTSDVHISVSQSNPTAPPLRFPDGLSELAVLETLSQEEPVLEVAGSTEDAFGQESADTSITGQNTTKDGVAEVEAHQPINYEQQVASWKSSWLQVSLEDAEVKFAVSIMSKFCGVY